MSTFTCLFFDCVLPLYTVFDYHILTHQLLYLITICARSSHVSSSIFPIECHCLAVCVKHTTGHLRYLKLGCLENPLYVELIPHSRAFLLLCYCISTLPVSISVMTKTGLCRSDNLLSTEKRTLVHPYCVELQSQKSVFAHLISKHNLLSLELLKNVLTCFRSGNIRLKLLLMG